MAGSSITGFGPDRMRDRALLIGAMLIAGALLLLLVGRPIPIVIWDEGRIVVSAMEMRHSGFSSIATYDYHPDLWNTKPPLLVWLMSGALALFGPSEWALRFPSLAASIGTLMLVLLFLRRVTGSTAAGLLGATILATSIGFFGEHGARTADYDALLCFLTTSYLLLAFLAVQRRRPAPLLLLGAGAAAGAALLTKDIAGAMPLPGLAIYLIVSGRWRRLLQSPAYAATAILALVPLALFLLVREAQAPGYVAAMLYNDVTSRFGQALDAHAGPPWYYLQTTFFDGLFSFGPATLLAPLGLPFARGRRRQALLLALSVALGQLLAVSFSATKLTHYYLAAYPFLAIAIVLAAGAIIGSLRRAGGLMGAVRLVQGTVALLVAIGAMQAAAVGRPVLAAREDYPRTRYGALLTALGDTPGPVLVLETGIWNPDDDHYAPELRFYEMQARERGRTIAHSADPRRIAAARAGTILASCDARFLAALALRGPRVAAAPGCLAVRAG